MWDDCCNVGPKVRCYNDSYSRAVMLVGAEVESISVNLVCGGFCEVCFCHCHDVKFVFCHVLCELLWGCCFSDVLDIPVADIDRLAVCESSGMSFVVEVGS